MNAAARALPPEAAPPLPPARPARAGGMLPCPRLLTQTILHMEGEDAAAPLDVLVARALGWVVEPRQVGGNGARRWMARSPLSTRWITLPTPSRDLAETRRVVPHGWSWGVGQRLAQSYGWCAGRWPVTEGVPFFECTGARPELALLRAALFAQRHLAMAEAGYA